jgi:hypothetical protein
MLSTATSPPAQYIVFAGNYYYNWSCVQAAGSANLCPPASEWHVPTDTEMKSLVSNTAESTLISEWGFGGYVINGDELVETTITSRFWTSSPTSATGANALQFGFREYRLQSISARAGLMVRCVKD